MRFLPLGSTGKENGKASGNDFGKNLAIDDLRSSGKYHLLNSKKLIKIAVKSQIIINALHDRLTKEDP